MGVIHLWNISKWACWEPFPLNVFYFTVWKRSEIESGIWSPLVLNFILLQFTSLYVRTWKLSNLNKYFKTVERTEICSESSGKVQIYTVALYSKFSLICMYIQYVQFTENVYTALLTLQPLKCTAVKLYNFKTVNCNINYKFVLLTLYKCKRVQLQQQQNCMQQFNCFNLNNCNV